MTMSRAQEWMFWRDAERDKYKAVVERLESQLPEEMRDCTIRFKECDAGHGWLTADNWVQHSCMVCEVERLTAALRRIANFPHHPDGCGMPGVARAAIEREGLE